MRTLFSLVFLLIITVQVDSQETPYVQGEILIQTHANYSAQSIVEDIMDIPGFESLKFEQELSQHMRFSQLSFDSQEINDYELKRTLSQHKGVSLCQFNHIVSERETIPNDPQFDEQWHHIQDGDHDIDSELAWDITTGGTTAFGDEIVVCVIEGGGADWDHEDLIDNHWVNENEIPDNGIDDDNNGFVDDYDGWNPEDLNDNIPGGNHGTEVSSMIGAKGNNGIGVAGANWDVGIMQCTVGSLNEANVIAAYNYPLTMRKLYNESSGELGAFVVATNASWGIDGGNPDDAPMWCAYYDSLGVYGVLNCGATANNNVNIDVVGDLPTGCPSDYMVSVTATNDQDVRTFSGYGIESIDLGAPGESVYMAQAGGGYGNSSGTSFASPCVAGIIGLLYSAPCPSMMALVQADPQAGADFIREALYEGVDPISNLTDEVATGGRANSFNSLNYILSNCAEGDCLVPFAINVDWTEGDLYEVTWGSIPGMESFNLRYREVGTPTWLALMDIEDPYSTLVISNWCSEYEVQIQSNCEDDEQSDWSPSYYFYTEGCCVAPDVSSIEVTSLDDTSISIEWEEVLAAENFSVEYTIAGENDWQVLDASSNGVDITGLEACESYELRILTECESEDSDYSETFFFSTLGCGSCADMEYCEITGLGTEEWISKVQINTLLNETGTDDGYGDYTSLGTTLDAGSTYDLTLSPGFPNFPYEEYFKVWIDYNGDGDFDDAGEFVFDQGETTSEQFTTSITIQEIAFSIDTRMRVSMDYVGSFGGGTPPVECGALEFGEAEDYCVFINGTNGVMDIEEQNIEVYPNPTESILNIVSTRAFESNSLVITDISGKTVLTTGLQGLANQVDISGLTTGCYFYHIKDGESLIHRGKVIKK